MSWEITLSLSSLFLLILERFWQHWIDFCCIWEPQGDPKFVAGLASESLIPSFRCRVGPGRLPGTILEGFGMLWG